MIDFNKDYILENEKVKLIPLEEKHFENLLEFSVNEPEIWKYNAFGGNGKENLQKYIETALSNKKSRTEYPFVAIDKKTDKIVGSTRFYLINIINKTLELGYTWYGKNFQGTYINKNCKYLLLSFAFDELGFERVGFRANAKNNRSIAAMKNIGCTTEGIMRNYGYDADGERIDAIFLSIIKDEWKMILKKELKSKIEL